MSEASTGPRNILHEATDELRRAGKSAVSLDELERLATHLAPHLSVHEIERQKTILPLEHGRQVELFKATMEAGQTALRTAIAINGGAAAALLAFLGNLAAKQVPPSKSLPTAMLVFVAGVFLAAASLGARYLTQLTGAQARNKAAVRFNNTAIALGVASLLAFCAGGIVAYLGLR